jgi:hypothetical protein
MLTSLSFAFGQDSDCYNHYYKVFKERGAYKINDGVHENVIISVRGEGDPECFLGKVEVKGGNVVKMFLSFEDDTYELFDPKLKNDYATTISRGISRSQITMDDEIINVFFIKKIKPKKKKYKKAPLIKIEDL